MRITVIAITLLSIEMLIHLAVDARRLPSFESCDWTGSGSHQMVRMRSVKPVYLRCSQGMIQWNYPQGALRVVLRYGLSGSEFKACFRMIKGSSGARVLLPGHENLHLLFRDVDPVGLVKCVSSRNAQLTIYVEADYTNVPLRKTMTGFHYYLRKISERVSLNDEEECQPCSEEQLLKHYCTSDFVVRGTVSGLFHNSLLKRSEVTVRASKVFRDSEPPTFLELSSAATQMPAKYANLHRSLNCGTKAGNGEFLFLGRWILGNPTLTCAPRLAEWKKIRRKAIKNGINHCELD